MTLTSDVGQQYLGKYCCLTGFMCILSFLVFIHFTHISVQLRVYVTRYVLIWGTLGIVWTVRFYFVIQKSEEDNSGWNQRTSQASVLSSNSTNHYVPF